jgi:hypothetical protein
MDINACEANNTERGVFIYKSFYQKRSMKGGAKIGRDNQKKDIHRYLFKEVNKL